MKKHLLPLGLLAALTGLGGATAQTNNPASSPATPPPYPRIAVRNGHFVNKATGAIYTPVGANYAHVMPLSDGRPGHAVFSPAYYDPKDMDLMMADLQAGGMNTLRVFQDYDTGKDGIVVSRGATEISSAYLANVVDFLQAARRHGLHVIFTWDTWNPSSFPWESTPLANEAQFSFPPKPLPGAGTNNQFLNVVWGRVRGNAILALIDGIRQADPELLRVVMAWELQNEVTFKADQEPLKSKPTQFNFSGKNYDLSTDDGAQAWMDNSVTQWANMLTDAIHQDEPDALVSASVFPFGAVHRDGPGQLSKDQTQDQRVPARPLALLHTHLDYVDLHIYAWKGPENYEVTYRENMASEEAPQLLPQAAKLGKPLLVGETGVFSNFLHPPGSSTPDYLSGIPVITAHLKMLKADGFAGALYWEYGNASASPTYEGAPLRWFPDYIQAIVQTWNGSGG